MSLIKSNEVEQEQTYEEPQEERIPRISEMSHQEAKRAFIRAIKNENHSNLKRILKYRFDIDINMNSSWPLLYSIENGCLSIVKVLLSQADLKLNAQSGKALLTAVEYGQYKIFKLLIEAGADINICCYRLMEVVKEAGDSRFKFHLTKKGFTHFHAHTPSYLKR
jgi:ankyrin repeat protein